MATVVAGLRTTGKDLRRLLERSGARHKLEGAEKLDLLIWLADQVKYCIEERRRMDLEIGDLEQLLRKEGIEPGAIAAAVAGGAGVSISDLPNAADGRWGAKTAVVGLLLLRRREIARLGYDTDRERQFRSGDASFEMALALMPDDQVGHCFAMVPCGGAQDCRSPSAASGATLPGQVETPRRERAGADWRRRTVGEAVGSSDAGSSMRRSDTDAARAAGGSPTSRGGAPTSPMSYCGWSVPPPPPVPPRPPPTEAERLRSRDGVSASDVAPPTAERREKSSKSCVVM